jgi:hypothetical protein
MKRRHPRLQEDNSKKRLAVTAEDGTALHDGRAFRE